MYDPELDPYICVDCSINTALIDEYYMLQDEVWLATGLGLYDGMLCIGCVEIRLNRVLVPEDFCDIPMNFCCVFHQSDCLKQRLNLIE